MMYESKARKGPLHGVKLTAPLKWDGKVGRPNSDEFYPGHYYWTGRDWLWLADRFNFRNPKSRTARTLNGKYK